MVDPFGAAVRTVGFAYGAISTLGGVAVFVLFGGIPVDVLYGLPPGVGRAILDLTPWLVHTDQSSGAGPLVLSLVALAFVGFGLWSLGTALFGSGG
jgi:hypothetical protein